MRFPYGEGLATRPGPAPCTVAGNGGGEALVRGDAGRVLSRENPKNLVGRPSGLTGKATRSASRYGERRFRSGAVVDPEHVSKLLAREPGDPVLGPMEMAIGSVSEGDR